ncbi:MAG: LamG domain-containing protein [Candidatus Anammoximicrobium sp.]|nr:LamG domain-containing protein [Candidatus Anammoximicrobium sp.]
MIEAAFYRQIAYVRTYQLGPHSDLSQKTLNEIAAARACLSEPTEKAAYDEELRRHIRTCGAAEYADGSGHRAVDAPPVSSDTTELAVVPAEPIVSARHQKQIHRERRPWRVCAALGAAAVLLTLLLSLFLSRPRSDTGTASKHAETPRSEVVPAISNAPVEAGAEPKPAGGGLTSDDAQIVGGSGASSSLSEDHQPMPTGAKLVLTFEPNTLTSKDGKTEIRDIRGNGQVAILSAGQIVPGKIGDALSLDDGERIGITGDYPSGAAPRTFAAWIRAHPKGVARSFQGVAYYGPGRVEGRFGIATVRGKWYFYGWGTGHDLSTNVPVDTEWHHHAVAYDGKNILYYYDAQLVLNTLPRSRRPLNTGSRPAFLGSPMATFAGCIDEIAIFDRVLEPEEVRTLFEMGERNRPLRP